MATIARTSVRINSSKICHAVKRRMASDEYPAPGARPDELVFLSGRSGQRPPVDMQAHDSTGRTVSTGTTRLCVSICQRRNGLVRFEADVWRLSIDFRPELLDRLRAKWQGEVAGLPRRLLSRMQRRFSRTFFEFDVMPERVEDWRNELEALLRDSRSYVPVRPMPERLSWAFKCDICHKPVAVRNGIVQHGRLPEEYRRALGEWKLAHEGRLAISLGDLMSRPTQPQLWQLGHFDCLRSLPDHYAFELLRCSAPLQAIEWTTHLSRKAWFDPSDWADFLERHFLQPVWKAASQSQDA